MSTLRLTSDMVLAVRQLRSQDGPWRQFLKQLEDRATAMAVMAVAYDDPHEFRLMQGRVREVQELYQLLRKATTE